MIIVNHDRIPVEGATTRIKNPKAGNAADAIKSFNFDYSYWSKEVSGNTALYAFSTEQKKCIIHYLSATELVTYILLIQTGMGVHENLTESSALYTFLMFRRSWVVCSPSWQHVYVYRVLS